MKVKLLKKLRQEGRDQVNIYSITTTNGRITGMEYGYPSYHYRNVWSYGDTEEEVKEKGFHIWLSLNIDRIRKRYIKYTCKYKKK